MDEIGKPKRIENYRYVLTNLFGIGLIVVGGLFGILKDFLLWYPLGLLTTATISSILSLIMKD